MSHTMKIWERIIEGRVQEETSIGKEQFGFMLERSTIDAVFEKAFDSVPWQEVWSCMRKRCPGEVCENYTGYVQRIQDPGQK